MHINMVKKKPEHEKKRKVTITLDPKIYEKFITHCDERAMKVSSKIELLIKKELEKGE